ncbi:hypothetical protein JW756_03175 [Candidatus Woesearchaeota archaeon]|nr:hypothetical protein [Candidatus Woesearchaeota archaeon]
MDLKKLESLGLSRNEARIYLSLLSLGEAQAGRISKAAQMNRPATYDALDRLMEKGLVSHYSSANRKVFKPAHPNVFNEQLKERKEAISDVLPELNALFNSSKAKEGTEIFVGRKGIKSILNDVLLYRKYVAFGSSGKFLEIMKHDFVAFQNRKRELRIDSKIVQAESARKNIELRRVAYASFKYLPDSLALPVTIIVYGEKTAIFSWGDTPMATLITSQPVSKSFQQYFQELWKMAKN